MPLAPNISPELDALLEQGQYICERASMPRWSDIDRLRELGIAWDKAGRPLTLTDIKAGDGE